MTPDLIPQKRLAAELGVSRSSLWRIRRSGIAGLPEPVIVRGRVYWRQRDLAALRAALDRYPGRTAFEEQQRYAIVRAYLAEVIACKVNKGERKYILHTTRPPSRPARSFEAYLSGRSNERPPLNLSSLATE